MKHDKINISNIKIPFREFRGRALATLALFFLSFSLFAQNYVANSNTYTSSSGATDITAHQEITLSPGFHATSGSDVHVYINKSIINYELSTESAIEATTATDDKNYIHTTVMREPTSNKNNLSSKKRIETIKYFDGLGRPVQSIAIGASPNKKDIVTALAYDNYGRQNITYLPYVSSNSSNGAYVTNATTECTSFYSNAITGHESASNPYNEILFESSPLNREEGAKGPGAWKSKPTNIEYSTNATNLAHWNADKTAFSFGKNQLYVTTYTDEDGNQTREYKDKLNRVVRKESSTNKGSSWVGTSYVYDDFGNLVIVVPPKASSASDSELCYYYTYDGRKRMTQKDLPGAEPVYMVYDNRDRLVLTQDGNLRENNKWMATVYDAFNRPVITALISNSSGIDVVQAAFKSTSYTATQSGTCFGYTTNMPSTYSVDTSNTQTVTYYDDYSLTPSGYDFISGLTEETKSTKTKGLVTGTITRVIDQSKKLYTVTYYDDFSRPIQVISDNHLGSKDVICSNYNFAGEVTSTTTIHNYGKSDEIRLISTFDYDHQGRMLVEKSQVKDKNKTTDEIILAAYEYNELGELATKYLHGNASSKNYNQKIDYSYNIKGWLRTLNNGNLDTGNDLFALDLRYNTPSNSSITGLYNGNISEMHWNTRTAQSYGFTYDGLNRLKTATSSTKGENTSYTYDDNGNFTNLTRYKNQKLIDKLTYNYKNNGNQIKTVTDAGTTDGYSAGSGSYIYDNNGNMTYDPGKEFYVDYNFLNLPKAISNSNEAIYYTYNAAGNKLSKTVGDKNQQNGTRTDYCGNFLYVNNKLKAIFTSEGRIVLTQDNGSVLYNYEYNLKDHLGNVRVTFTANSNGTPTVTQTTSYYPFGMVLAQTNNFDADVLANKYLYNGKELQDDELGGTELGWYDYGARFYDPELGRFHSIDPLAEDYSFQSPYTYGLNNPIRFVDYMGMSGQEPEENKVSGFSISDWVHSMANALGFNMKSMGSATSTAEMEQVAAHNEQQSANLENTETAVKAATAITATVIATPLAIAATPEVATGTIVATEGAALKGTISAVAQAIANDGKIDPLTVATDAVLTPGAGNLIDAAIDVNISPETGVQVDVVGINKTPKKAAVDFIIGYGFGKANNKATNQMLKYTETEAQKYYYKSAIGVTSGVVSSKVKK